MCVCVCVRVLSENSEPTTLFSQKTPDEHPPTPPPCRWPAFITLRTPTKFQLVWRRLYDVLFRSSCLLERTLCAYPRIGLVVLANIMCIRRFCDHTNVLHTFDQTCIVLKSGSSSTTGPPDRWSSSFVSVSPPDATAKPMASSHHFSPFAKLQLVWRRLCEALRSSSLTGLKHPSLQHDHRRRADRTPQITASFTRDRRRAHWHI